MMYCSKCGTYNADGASFCASCGASLKQAPAAQPRQEPQPAPQPAYSSQPAPQPAYSSQPAPQPAYGSQPVSRPPAPQPPKKSKLMPILVAVLSVLLAAAIVVILILTLGGKGDDGISAGSRREGSIAELREEPKLEDAFFTYFEALTTFDMKKINKVVHPAMQGWISEEDMEYFREEAREENIKFRNLQVTDVRYYDDKKDFRDLEEELEEEFGERIRVSGIADVSFTVEIVTDGEADEEEDSATFFQTDGKWYFLGS